MSGYLQALQDEAERSIAAMREAALAARAAHARTELMRHMLTTAQKLRDRPKDQAIEGVVLEWMRAWHLDRDAWPHVEREMRAMTAAFYDFAASPSDAAETRIRESYEVLRRAIAKDSVTLEDHMAWRSRCAHGWWAEVRPAPPELRQADEASPEAPFWMKGCRPECL
jgi:hypothetical protein